MEPSPEGERSSLLSSPDKTESDVRPASPRANPSPTNSAPSCRDESFIAADGPRAGPVQTGSSFDACAVPLVPTEAVPGRHDALATCTMVDGYTADPRVGAVANTSEPPQRCIPSSCAHTVQTAQHDRPSDRVKARRRDAQRSIRAVLADPSHRGLICNSPARPNGADIGAGSVGQYDSTCTVRPRARVGAGLRAPPPATGTLPRANAVLASHPSITGTFPMADEPLLLPGPLRTSIGAGSVGHYDSTHLCTVRPRARVGAGSHAPRRVPPATGTLPCAYAVLASHPSITDTLPMADEPLLLPGPLRTGPYT